MLRSRRKSLAIVLCVFSALILVFLADEVYSKVVHKQSLMERISILIEPSFSSFETYEEFEKRELNHMNDSEWTRLAYQVCDPDCVVPSPRTKEELNSYFRSLDVDDNPLYFLIQFNTTGADPSKGQREELENDGIKLISLAFGRTWYAKAPKEVLESKSYDFIRWAGITNFYGKMPASLVPYIMNSHCSGSVRLFISFVEPLSLSQAEEISELTALYLREGEINLEASLDLAIVRELDQSYIKSFSFGGYGGLNGDSSSRLSSDPLENLFCTSNE